jgi:ketosteroid isomerase-like protein
MNRSGVPVKAILAPLACGALAACACLAPGYADPQLEDLFNAERTFARDASRIGVRPAFLAHFADDAIVFMPGPVRYVEHVKAHPATGDPMATLLEWSPQAGAVSRAGDVGFTAGPSRWSKRGDPAAEVGHGYYFSVWTRVGGAWKVAIDAGVTLSAPAPAEGVPNMRTPILWHAEEPRLDAAQRAAALEALFAMERMPRTRGVVARGGAASEAGTPWRDLLALSPIVVRDGAPPLTGDAVARDADASPPTRIEWSPQAGAVAASGDLAYTYGASRMTSGTAVTMPGYYVHVWQREGRDAWRLRAEVDLPGG